MKWNNLQSVKQLEDIDSASNDGIQMIFKHSTRCSISTMAKSRLEKNWAEKLNVTPYYLDLIQHRDISLAIADRYNVHHESPQILIIKNGESIHDASHLDISVKEIEDVL